jgi:hypothetical protein
MCPNPNPISEMRPSTTCHVLATHTPPNSTPHSLTHPPTPPPPWPLSWFTYIHISVR